MNALAYRFPAAFITPAIGGRFRISEPDAEAALTVSENALDGGNPAMRRLQRRPVRIFDKEIIDRRRERSHARDSMQQSLASNRSLVNAFNKS